MARPRKEGLEYFPLDCRMDDKIQLIEAEFGLKGFAVVVKLYQEIYGGFGYYCEWTPEIADRWALLNSKRVVNGDDGSEQRLGSPAGKGLMSGFSDNLINQIVAASIRWGLFSREHFEKYHILTSEGIQRRYLEAVSRRKDVTLKNEYLILNDGKNGINVDNNSVNVDINSINVDRNSQSKSKSKSKIKKDQKDIYTSPYKTLSIEGVIGGEKKAEKRFTPPTVEEVRAYCQERKNGIDPEAFCDFYESKGWRIGKDPMKDWRAAIRTWEHKRKTESSKKPEYEKPDYDAIGEKAKAEGRSL